MGQQGAAENAVLLIATMASVEKSNKETKPSLTKAFSPNARKHKTIPGTITTRFLASKLRRSEASSPAS
jgi:hypothetical protein